MGYMIEYEYVKHNGNLVRVKCCSVFSTYEEAEAFLCEEMGLAEANGYTEVQGDIKEAEE